MWIQRRVAPSVSKGVNRGSTMADHKTARGPQDTSRIAMGEDYEVQ